MIILLDLNYTLCANSAVIQVNRGSYADRIAIEEYRHDLIELIRPHTVFLVTVRDARYQAQTLRRIQATTGWQPDEAFFNDRDLPPTPWKEHVLTTHVLPRFAGQPMMAIESNDSNAAMYIGYGILSVKCWGGQHGKRGAALPRRTPAEPLFQAPLF